MAEDLMSPHKPNHPSAQAGFSMIEMLMTAFILAIGLLGLCMLQTMSLRTTRGSKTLATAVNVSEGVMDKVELEGRLSWLNLTYTNATAPTLGDLPNLRYITLAANTPRVESYNIQGQLADPDSTDPLVRTPVFTVATTKLADVGVADGTGQMSNFRVVVTFTDNVDVNNAPVQRVVTLTRSITHG